MDDIKNMSEDIKAYDFEKSRKFSNTNIKFLEYIADEYCKTSNLQLLHELKHQDLKFSVIDSKQQSLTAFLEDTSYDSVLIDFSIGRANSMIIKIDKKCALTFIECLLGSDGKLHNESRNITGIDIAILTYLNEMLLKRLAADIADDKPVEIKAIYTNTAQFRTLLPAIETLFVSKIDVTLLDETIGEMCVCVPLTSVEGVMHELIAKNKGDVSKLKSNTNTSIEDEAKIVNVLNENKVPIDIVAELGKAKITVGQLLELKTGDVLILNKKIKDPVDVLVGGSVAYKAKPGISNSSKAIIIEDFAEIGE